MRARWRTALIGFDTPDSVTSAMTEGCRKLNTVPTCGRAVLVREQNLERARMSDEPFYKPNRKPVPDQERRLFVILSVDFVDLVGGVFKCFL